MFDKIGIHYQRQFKFDNCKNKRLLPFDFAIFPHGKKMGLVEFHGEQHYRPIPYWGGKKKFDQVQKNDLIKQKFANTEGIPLLIIPFTEIDSLQETIKGFLDL